MNELDFDDGVIDSEKQSPLKGIYDNSEEVYSGDSPLSKIMLGRAKEISPRRQDIISRRDALLEAYKNLISAQKNRPLPVRNPSSWMAGAAGLMQSEDPNMKAFGSGQIARFKVMKDQNDSEAEALKNQALTQLQMDTTGLGFLDKDQAAEIELLKQSGLMDRSEQLMQMKMMLQAMKNNQATDPIAEPTTSPGVPSYSGTDPYLGLDAVGKRQMRMNFEKQVQKLQEDAESNSSAIQRMKRFQQLNELTKDNIAGPGPISDFLPNFSDEMKEMESIASEITPQMRVPGSGATSDFDARMFKKATVGTGKSYETNKNISEAYIASRQDQIDKSQFMESYLNANGHLRGAQQLWRQYLNENPIFDPNSKDFSLNQSRKQWQEYFGGTKEGLDEKATQSVLPPPPAGYDARKWEKVYNKMTPEQKKLFGGQ